MNRLDVVATHSDMCPLRPLCVARRLADNGPQTSPTAVVRRSSGRRGVRTINNNGGGNIAGKGRGAFGIKLVPRNDYRKYTCAIFPQGFNGYRRRRICAQT